MKIGLLGGSFNPIHAGHIALGRAALRQLRLDRVYFVLSPNSPFKTGYRQTPASIRFRLVEGALLKEKKLVAADWEMRRRGPSYTIDTVRRYRRKHPNDKIFLLMGSDALAGFPRWKKAEELAGMCTLVSARRPGAPKPKIRYPCRWLKGRFPDISSTKLRGPVFYRRQRS